MKNQIAGLATLAVMALPTVASAVSAESFPDFGSAVVFTANDSASVTAGQFTGVYPPQAIGSSTQSLADGSSGFLEVSGADRLLYKFNVSASFRFDAPADAQFAYSKSQIQYLVQIEGLGMSTLLEQATFTGMALAPVTFSWALNVPLGLPGIKVNYSWSFVPGQYAIASDDPACASVLCMGSASATNPSAFVGITATVPEPETYALMLAGLGLVTAAARRRR